MKCSLKNCVKTQAESFLITRQISIGKLVLMTLNRDENQSESINLQSTHRFDQTKLRYKSGMLFSTDNDAVDQK